MAVSGRDGGVRADAQRGVAGEVREGQSGEVQERCVQDVAVGEADGGGEWGGWE